MTQEIPLKIIIEHAPAGIDFGLQKGSGNTYETIQIQRSGDKNLEFEFTITVKTAKDGLPNFLGAFVQGPTNQRFVYIDIGASAGQHTHWSRRMKIPLIGIDWDTIRTLSTNSSSLLVARVHGTGKDNGPTCGTVKPFAGWHVVERGDL